MCGALRAGDVNREVSLYGWVDRRREHGEHLAFIDLRDHTGVVQCVVDGAHDLRPEYVLRVNGSVRLRRDGTANTGLPTGEVEIGDCRVEVLNPAEPPPFPLGDRVEPDEALRLRYRYVDLRRPRMQKNLRLRAAVNFALRQSMHHQGFVEVETPLLIASTPEGARDFVVPSRLQPGRGYALPQSPQLFKQLLMVGGVDRYYQLARCLRDEDLRSDRQFEFTQLDLEASFVDQHDVMAVVNRAAQAAAGVVDADALNEFTVGSMTWQDAQERYGTDKPDLRFGMELVDVTPVFAASQFRAFQPPVAVKGFRVEGGGDITRARLDRLTEQAKASGAAGLVWMRVGSDGVIDSPVAKFLAATELSELASALSGAPGDLLLLVAGERPTVNRTLGVLRLEIGRPPVTEGGRCFIWVTDFPLFEGFDDTGGAIAAHHPFTMPHPEDLDLLESDPMAVRSLAYDLVLNGWELGSGSVRIHRADIQQKMFALLGIDAEQAQARFGFLLDAFRHGAPPHAGFALGIDRLMAILAGEENIREVIAFPKTQSGADPLTGAPTAMDARHLSDLGLRLK